ncbi:rhodanese-like domain-containing protein [Paenibacillus sinopodophylli]|uniref:rhodanese-like domain-containing protein n=1 Tax=Paenibacillus sinopodophylli TaxID=1837342 RepID=UPI00110CD0B4|nr:rhodanese-like domain-containing protein [Paenibacillus sinopodophylli]
MTNWQDVTPQFMLDLLESGSIEASQLIDVREEFEWDYYHLETSVLIPMNTIPMRLNEITDSKPLYIICAHGVRSLSVCRYLEEQGYSELHNVNGGMAAIALLKGFQYD